MDDQLALRIQLFREGGQIKPEVADFVTAFLTDDQVAAELAGHPEAVTRARAVAERARRELGAALPESEVNFLGMHLAVLAQQPPATPSS